MNLRPILPVLLAAFLPLPGCGGCNSETPLAPGTAPRGSAREAALTTTTSPPPIDPGPYALYRPRRWTAGDVIAVEASANTTGRVTQVLPDGRTSPLPDLVESLRTTWKEQAADVDVDGRRTRYLVHLDVWSRKRGRVRDTSIEGATLAVSGAGGGRGWAFVTHEGEPTAEANNWLDEHFGAHGLDDEQWLRMMLSAEKLPAGATWNPDPAMLAKEVTGSGLAVDPASVRASASLERIAGALAECRFKVEMVLLRVPNADASWSKGGSLAFEGSMSVPVAPATPMLAALDRRATLAGETVDGGTTMRINFVTEERRTTTLGGTFPGAPR